MSKKLVSRRKRKANAEKKQKTVRMKEYAVIGTFQDRSSADNEYTTSREERVWYPKEDMEEWIHHYSCAARVVLTYKQQHDSMPSIEAIEKSCSGVAQQYILDVLYENKHDPHEALRMIFQKDMPQQVIDKWKPEEMKLFTEGVMKHGKNFSIIRRKMLPHKQMQDLTEFYYVWKGSSMAKAWREARAIIKAKEKEMKEKRLKNRTNESPYNLLNNELLRNLPNDRIMTRSVTAAAILSLQNGKGTDDSKSSTSTSPSEKYEETSSAARPTDSSMEHDQKHDTELPETATSEKSPMKNEQYFG